MLNTSFHHLNTTQPRSRMVAGHQPTISLQRSHCPPRGRNLVSSEPRRCARFVAKVASVATTSPTLTTMTEEYNKTMQKQMGWDHLNPYEYHPERGLYYHEISSNLICGCQPRNAEEVTYLKEHEKVTHILNLQQDADIEHWGVDLNVVRNKCQQLGITHLRRPARDFDPHSLRTILPCAVQAVHESLSQGGRLYVHCTAGLGRAPAVVIAYLYWFTPRHLDDAYAHLTAIRPCGPKKDAIRGATFDLMDSRHFDAFTGLPPHAWSCLNDQDRQRLQQRLKQRNC